jgi:hypothetical protein
VEVASMALLADRVMMTPVITPISSTRKILLRKYEPKFPNININDRPVKT